MHLAYIYSIVILYVLELKDNASISGVHLYTDNNMGMYQVLFMLRKVWPDTYALISLRIKN